MPRGSRSINDEVNPRTQRPGRLIIPRMIPPNSRVPQNGASKSTTTTGVSPADNVTNSTLTETQAPKLFPILSGATSGVANSTSSATELEQNASANRDIHDHSEHISLIPGFPLLVGATSGNANSTSSTTELEQNASAIHNQTKHINSIPGLTSDVGGNPSDVGHSSNLPASVAKEEPINPSGGSNKNFHRTVYLTSLLPTLGKKIEGMPIMDSSTFSSPSWIQTFEKAGLLKAVASEGLAGKRKEFFIMC